MVVEDVNVRQGRASLVGRVVLFAALLAAMAGATGFFLAHGRSLLPTLFLALPMVAVAGFLLFFRRLGPVRDSRGKLRVEDKAIFLGDQKVIDADAIDSAWVAPKGQHTRLTLTSKARHEPPIEILLDEVEEARRIVRTLGLDADRRAATIDARSPYAAQLLPVATLLSQTGTLWRMIGAPNGPLPFFLLPIWIVAATGWIIAASRSRKVRIGRDGVHLSWIGRRRFLPHASIERVQAIDNVVKLHLVGGEIIDLPIGRATKRAPDDVNNLAPAVVDRIERARMRDESAPNVFPKVLDAEGRTAAEWIAALRGERMGTFREGELDRAELWHVVENGEVDHARRAAAAAVLSRSLDEPEKARLRVAAEASAEPKLRVALEAAAEADEPAMIGAIEKLRRKRA